MAKTLKDGCGSRTHEIHGGLVRAGVPRDVAKALVHGPDTPSLRQRAVLPPQTRISRTMDSGDAAERLLGMIRQMPEMQALREMSEAYERNKKKLGQLEKRNQIKSALDKDPELSRLYESYTGRPKAQRHLLDSVALAVQGRLPEFPAGTSHPFRRPCGCEGYPDRGGYPLRTARVPLLASARRPSRWLEPISLMTRCSSQRFQDCRQDRSIFDPDYAKSVTARIGRFMRRGDD